MKIEDSPAKQQAVKKHIEQVVEQKLSQIDKAYREKKETFVEKNCEKKRNEVTKAIKPLIELLRRNEEILIKEAEDLNYNLGKYEMYGYSENRRMSVHEIENENIENALEEDFDEDNKTKYEKLKEQVETKKTEIIEKILFADEQELVKLIGELNAIKIEF